MAGEFDLTEGRDRFVWNCPCVPPVREDGSLGNGRYQGKRIRKFKCPGGTGDACRRCNSRINPRTGRKPIPISFHLLERDSSQERLRWQNQENKEYRGK